jgi:hypothetical protein
MKHRGEIVLKAIQDSGIPKSHVAEAVGYTTRHFYSMLDKANLSLELIIKIGKFIHHDFKNDLPEIFGKPEMAMEDREKYNTIVDCLKEKQEILLKYTSLLEDHNRLITEGMEKFFAIKKKKLRKA